MKKRALSLLLASTMVVSLTACGGGDNASTSSSDTGTKNDAASAGSSSNDAASNDTNDTAASGDASGDTTAGKPDYHEVLKDGITVVVNGTLTASVDNGQADFEKQWEEAVGIDLTIQQLDHSGYTDAVGRLFASQDYPDAMIMSAEMFKQYAPTGLLWDMADAYANAEFQSRITLPAINENMKDAQGHLYAFAPAYGNGCVTYVKKAWLDAVGINIDDIKTYDDYYNMLKAFHDGDPDGNGVDGDTYGVVAAGFIGTEAPWINYLPEFWQGAFPAIYQKDDGTWVDGFQEDATKEALLRMQQAYKDGAIDPETLTASTKIAREKWFSNDQKGSAGVFTYWAGTWYRNLTDFLIKNEVDEELVQLPPIQEIKDTFGGYLNREAPVWVIIDQGDPVHNQAVFDALLDTMLDGDVVQTLWVYGAEDVHWSTKAEEFTTNPGTEKEQSYAYEEGVFHMKPSPNDPNTVWKKNYIDPALAISPLTNGFNDQDELAAAGNKFFTENCVDAPATPVSETFTNESGTIHDAMMAVITAVVVDGGEVEPAMQTYVDTVGPIIDQCLAELNAAQ
ncbi:MAG: ABC transporter substrate-binding protein [Lachnospiraceae bacterium]|jgi:putative aldouronate transport system substrate-binding protein|nr:ABC transporter substrate-binding protein [Lachnospiraceae bacterium]